MLFWDYTYILVLIGALICSVAAINVKSTFNRYSSIHNARGMTGRDAAERVFMVAPCRQERGGYPSCAIWRLR